LINTYKVMALTPTYNDIKALDFGYLTGADLLAYCPFQFLAKQYAVDNLSLETGVQTAYNEIISQLTTRYDLTSEFAKTLSDRYFLMVKIVAIASIRNILAEFQNISDNVKIHFAWLDKTLKDIREGQISLINITVQSNETVYSVASLIKSSYSTLG